MAERRFQLRGDIDLAVADELQNKLLVLVNATSDDLVLDCTDLAFIDSTGIAAIMHVQRLLEIQDRGLRIENLHDMPRRAFDILGLTEVLVIEELDPA